MARVHGIDPKVVLDIYRECLEGEGPQAIYLSVMLERLEIPHEVALF